MRNLTILMTTRGDPHAGYFLYDAANFASQNSIDFLVGTDGNRGLITAQRYTNNIIPVVSKGYLESFLNGLFVRCDGEYIFRLDDDEIMSDALKRWIVETDNLTDTSYSFHRANLWVDEKHYLPFIYPDRQIRLTKKGSVVWPSGIHEIPSTGYGTEIPKAILHYKFIIKDLALRTELAKEYEKVRRGAGLGEDYKKYSIPEDYKDLKTNSLTSLKEVVYTCPCEE